MLKRTITAIVLVAIVAGAFFLGPKALENLIYILLAIAGYEVYRIRKDKWSPVILVVILAFIGWSTQLNSDHLLAYFSSLLISLLTLSLVFEWFTFEDASLVYVLVSLLGFVALAVKAVVAMDMKVFAYIIIATYATDTFAYLGGSLFGKHKLIERVSPNKTIEGSIIGYIGSVILSLLFAYFYVDLDRNLIIFASLLIPVVSQIGDLSFSLIKRKYNIKDYGIIFPGHGGVLDRVDSIVFSLLVFNIILTLV